MGSDVAQWLVQGRLGGPNVWLFGSTCPLGYKAVFGMLIPSLCRRPRATLVLVAALSFFFCLASSYQGPCRGTCLFSLCLGHRTSFFPGPVCVDSCSRQSWWTLGVGDISESGTKLGEGEGDVCISPNLSPCVCVCGLMGTLFCEPVGKA